MSEINITAPVAVKLLQEVIEGREDYVYEKPKGVVSCVYTAPDNSPSCIVGHVLARAGVPMNVLHAIDYGGAVVLNSYDEENDRLLDEPVEEEYEGSLDETGITEEGVQYWLNKNGVMIDERARYLLLVAQSRQDNEATWGDAVRDAIARMGQVSV